PGSRHHTRAPATARGTDELQGRRGREQDEGVEESDTVGVTGAPPECRGGGREGQGADDDQAPSGQASETGHDLFPFCGRTVECRFRQRASHCASVAGSRATSLASMNLGLLLESTSTMRTVAKPQTVPC